MANKQGQDAFAAFKAAMKAKKPARFYIFCGEEAYLRNYWLTQLKRLLVEPWAEEFNFHRFTSETISPKALSDCVESLPMMGEHTLVQVEDVDLFKADAGARADYAEILSDLPEHCTLVLVYDSIAYQPDRRQRSLTQALDRAERIEFTAPSERELCGWIARHFKSHGKSIRSDTCYELIRMTGGGMTVLAGEIEKIAAYAEHEEITRQDVEAVVEPIPEAVIFDLTDAVAAGKYETALVRLETLLQKQEEPIALLGLLSTQLRRLLVARLLLRAGKGTAELMSLCGMPSYPANKTIEFARRVSDRFCERAVVLCLETDEKMKSSYDTQERLLELLLLRLAQEARNA